MRINILKKLLMVSFFVMFSYFFCLERISAAEKSMTVPIKIFTNVDLNKDEQGQASPLKIIFVQLASKATFEQMDKMFLDDGYKEYFGVDMLEDYSLMIQPNEIQEFNLDIVDKAKYLGVILILRDTESVWKSIFEKQELGFFRKKEKYLNFEIIEDELVQIDQSVAAKLTLSKQLKKLEDEGLDVSGLSEKQIKKLESKIEKNAYSKVKPEFDKGVYKKY